MVFSGDKTKAKGNKGFTLAELLIVIAIVAVLVAIALPVFTNQLEKSREATDLANVRSAYAEVMAAANSDDDDLKGDDGSFQAVVEPLKQRQDGWSTNVENLSIGSVPEGEWFGAPRAEGQCTVRYIPDTDVCQIIWLTGAYAGQNVRNATEYNNLSYSQKLEKDELLLDSLQAEFREMTYAEIRDMFYNADGSKKEGIETGHLSGSQNLCITLSKTTINAAGDASGKIYADSAFEGVGYDTSSGNYAVNSVPIKEQTIWVNIGITEQQLLNGDGDQLATNAYTYVKSGGATTPDSLKEANRH